MNKKLSNREKKLISSLIIVAVVIVSFQYLILPEIGKFQMLMETNKSLALASKITINSKGMADAIDNDYVKYNQYLYNLINKKVSPKLTDENLDQFFTNLSIKHNLKPQALLIEYPSQLEQEINEKPYLFIKNAFVSITVAGDFNSVINLMSEIDQIEYLSITNMKSLKVYNKMEHTLKIQVIMLAGE